MTHLQGWLVSVNTNEGGVPKHPRPEGDVLEESGLASDHQAFEKHRKPHRAISIQSMEMLEVFQREGYRLAPGLMAENLTTQGVDWTCVADGSRIRFENGVELHVSEQRRPCFQLNPMGEGLEFAARGRSGVLCSVIIKGELKPGMRFSVLPSADGSEQD